MGSFMIIVVSALSLALSVIARQAAHQIVFDTPQYNHMAHGDDDAVDITRAKFYGLTTFANLPYMNCFDEAEMGSYDIAIMGAPFDTVSKFMCS
jgi:agmatinase